MIKWLLLGYAILGFQFQTKLWSEQSLRKKRIIDSGDSWNQPEEGNKRSGRNF